MTRSTKRKAVIFIMACALVIFAYTLVHALFLYDEPSNEPISEPIAASSTVQTVAPGAALASSSYPARLVIPSLNIDANVQYVGVNALGNMRAPNNFTDVAWYQYGTVPGMQGSAVIDGHVDNGLALAGVFKHLTDLKVGDDLYIQTRDGARLHFVVNDIEVYPYTAVPADQLFNKNDAAHLNLVTCDGAWVSGQDTYDHRLVVYSTLQGTSTML